MQQGYNKNMTLKQPCIYPTPPYKNGSDKKINVYMEFKKF